jgi:hypothetical protein
MNAAEADLLERFANLLTVALGIKRRAAERG